jgi:hypothetical protein
MANKLQLANNNETWNSNKRYKINAVVVHNGSNWQNATGKNSEPGVGTDWVNDPVTLKEVLGYGGRGVRFTPVGSDDAVFELADKTKVVLKRGNGDFFLNSGIFEVGDELIFEAILDGWGGGVSFGSDPIFVNGEDVSNDAVNILSNQRGFLFLSEIVSGVEYWIYRVSSDYIKVLEDYIKTTDNFANDSAAATGGVALGGLYHTSGTVKIRLT